LIIEENSKQYEPRYLYLPLAAGIFTPSLIILFLQVLIAKMSPIKAVLDILHKQFAEGHNLFILMLWSFIPYLLNILNDSERALSLMDLATDLRKKIGDTFQGLG